MFKGNIITTNQQQFPNLQQFRQFQFTSNSQQNNLNQNSVNTTGISGSISSSGSSSSTNIPNTSNTTTTTTIRKVGSHGSLATLQQKIINKPSIQIVTKTTQAVGQGSQQGNVMPIQFQQHVNKLPTINASGGNVVAFLFIIKIDFEMHNLIFFRKKHICANI